MGLKEVRESKGVKKCAVMAYLGVSQPTYDKYEKDPDIITLGQARAIADFLGVDPSEIFFSDDDS